MAETTEELNEGQAMVAVQQHVQAFRFMGQMDEVMRHYGRMKSEIPELQKELDRINAEMESARVELANLKTHHDQSLKEMEAEFKAKKDIHTKNYEDDALHLTEAIKAIHDRMGVAQRNVTLVEAKAREKIAAAEARVIAAQDSAAATLTTINESIAEKQSEYDALVEKLRALKMSISQVA